MTPRESRERPEDVRDSSGTGFFRGSVMVAAGLGVGQILAYGFYILGPRFLSADDFGALGTLLNILVVGSVLPMGVQAATTKILLSKKPEDLSAAGAAMLRFSLMSGSALALLLIVISPLLTSLLDQPSPWNIVLAALVLPAQTMNGCQMGIAQAHNRYAGLSSIIFLQYVLRFGLGSIALVLTGSLVATMMGLAVGSALTAALSQLIIRPYTSANPSYLPEAAAQTLHASHALLALFLATNVDLFMARIYLTGDESGAYAVGAIVARVAFWLPFFIILTTFSRMLDGDRAKATITALAAATVLGVGLVGALLLAPEFVLRVVAGPDYLFMAPYLWLFGLIGAAFSLSRVLLYSQLAAGQNKAVVLVWLDLIVIISGIAIWHTSVPTVATVTAVAAVLLLLAGLVLLLVEARGKPTSAEKLSQA